jgi:cysteinyl-tRNA synthetase
LAQYYTKIYFQHRQQLNLLKPHIICKASQHIPEMIKLIANLMEKKYAYIAPDGIYFRIKKFPRYGQLSGNTIQNLKAGARVQINIHKEHPADFALWKFTPPESKRQMEWKSPWGKGFPGWHIECSAMSMKYLGATIDIHTGGEDNIFPHHEAEIAQSEAVTNKKFVRFWFHPRFLMVNGEKMSKSLRNFYTLEDLQNKGFSPLALRYLFLTAHYRSKLNFNWQALAASQKALNNLYNEIAKLNINITAKTIHKNKKNYKTNKILSYEKKFVRAINNDLNIPQALSLVWQILKNTQLSANEKKFLVLRFDKVLGLNLHNIKTPKIPQKIKQLAIKREILRSNKQFIQADNLRKKIEQLGYKIEDTNQGPRIIKTKI